MELEPWSNTFKIEDVVFMARKPNDERKLVYGLL